MRQILRKIQSLEARGSLAGFFSPRSVAIIGASRTEGKLGHAVLSNIVRSGFRGAIYPVNPSADQILGFPRAGYCKHSHEQLGIINTEHDVWARL
jgi:acyl-CoA synthetase (NDP forming)